MLLCAHTMIARARVHIQASALGHVCFRHLASAPEGCSSVVFPRLFGAVVAENMLGEGAFVPNAEEGTAWYYAVSHVLLY